MFISSGIGSGPSWMAPWTSWIDTNVQFFINHFLNKVNTFAREIDERVKEVSVSLNGNHQNIEVITKNGDIFYDSRPLVRMNINITVKKKNKVCIVDNLSENNKLLIISIKLKNMI